MTTTSRAMCLNRISKETLEEVADHLDKIKTYFKPGVKVTILVRTEGDIEGRRDLMMGDDYPQEVLNMVARLMAAGRAVPD